MTTEGRGDSHLELDLARDTQTAGEPEMTPNSPTIKTVSVDDLCPGMFIERLDRSWLTTPFLRHRFVLRDEHDIAVLKRCGVRRVVIDTSKSTVRPPPPPVESVVEQQAPTADPVVEVRTSHPAPTQADALGVSPLAPDGEAVGVAAAVHADAVAAMERLFSGRTHTAGLDSTVLHTTVTRLRNRLTTQRSATLAAVRLCQLRRFDRNLFSHAVDVSVLSMAVGLEQGLHGEALDDLAMGALLHDIGEMRLPQNLLRKPGEFADFERKLMQHHPALGIAMLTEASDISAVIRRIVVEHHERLNGTGYPAKLQGEAIAPASQVVGLMDVYDALVTSRGGRPAISPAQAVRVIYQMGLNGQFSSLIVEQAIQSLGVYPIGSLVQLNTGERAVVIGVNPSLSLRPSVRLISDQQGRLLRDPLLMDLANPALGSSATAILRDLDAAKEHIDVAQYLEV